MSDEWERFCVFLVTRHSLLITHYSKLVLEVVWPVFSTVFVSLI